MEADLGGKRGPPFGGAVFGPGGKKRGPGKKLHGGAPTRLLRASFPKNLRGKTQNSLGKKGEKGGAPGLFGGGGVLEWEKKDVGEIFKTKGKGLKKFFQLK